MQPAFSSANALLESNQALLDQHDSRWNSLRATAREQLIKDAIRYTGVYRDTSWVDQSPGRPIIMAGHQPSLFHPGVWFKNFSLSQLANRLGATGVNLVVDNDVAKAGSIRVPTIDTATGLAMSQNVAYDDFGGGVPYEQTTVGNLERFDQFDRAVADTVRPLVSDPSVHELWPHARNAIARCGVAGCALAQARHGLEAEIGLQTLEIPLGVVCRSREFLEFALSILTELPRFQTCYNESTHSFRRAHGIRSTAHPVSDLAERDGWFEAPLWIYGNRTPVRKAVWVRMANDQLEISDLENRLIKIDIRNQSDAIDQLSAAMTPEFKIRPRALLTTMYSRLVLSDLFLHGIGGGKYDQLGDMITQSFFSITPPQFMVMSATVHLPGAQPSDIGHRIRQLKRTIRETHFQGERFADAAGLAPALVQQKRELLDSIAPRGQRQQWHLEITSANQQLSQSLESYRKRLESDLQTLNREAASQSILESREHPFCVYPLSYLTDTFNKMLATG